MRWLAFLLNLVFPPTGYVYAGMHRAAIGFCLAYLIVFAIGVAWMINFPPGPYAIAFRAQAPLGNLAFVGLGLGSLTGVHAAIAVRPRTTLTGGRAWAAAIALWLVPVAVAGGWRFLGPFGIYEGQSGSMIPTIYQGDILLTAGGDLRCQTPSLKAGDVITQVEDQVVFVKRVVAGPGQTVEMKDGRLIVDGKLAKHEAVGAMNGAKIIRETLSNGASYLIQDLGDTPYDQVPLARVPANSWFTLGDNRDNSLDSRHSGPTPTTQICGRGLKLLYAKDKAAIGRPL